MYILHIGSQDTPIKGCGPHTHEHPDLLSSAPPNNIHVDVEGGGPTCTATLTVVPSNTSSVSDTLFRTK